MFPCKLNILTGNQVRDGRNRRMNVHVYNPKEEQALPSNYEQLLNHTEHRRGKKYMYVDQKKPLMYNINLCIYDN